MGNKMKKLTIILTAIFMSVMVSAANAAKSDHSVIIGSMAYYDSNCRAYGTITDYGYRYVGQITNQYGDYNNDWKARQQFQKLVSNGKFASCTEVGRLLKQYGLAR